MAWNTPNSKAGGTPDISQLIDNDPEMAANSATLIPSQQAVKAMFDGFSIPDPSVVPTGLLAGLALSRKDAASLYVDGGSVEIYGTLFNSIERFAVGLAAPSGYENICVGGTASGCANGGGPELAFDGVTTDGNAFANLYANTDFLQYLLAAPRTPTALRLMFSANSDHTPRTFQLKASNTGTFTGEEVTLVNELDITAKAGWNTATWLEWTFENTTAFSYYRLTAPTSGVSSVFLLEMQLTEAIYALETSTPYFVYVNPLAVVGTTFAATDFILSATAPVLDPAKGGWYHPTDADQRAIGWFATNDAGEVPLGGPFALPGARLQYKNNLAAAAWPESANNLSSGYGPGSLWFTGGQLLVCMWADENWSTWQPIPMFAGADFLTAQVFS